MGRIHSGRTWHLVAVAMLASAPAWADVTITQTTSSKMGAGNMSGETVTRIKGHKMRVDNARMGNGDQTSMILDVDGNRMIVLNHTKKEAIVKNMADVGPALAKISDADMDAKLTPTAEKKQVAGTTCSVYDSLVSVKFSMMEKQPPIEVVMTGPVCLSKEAPGRADFAQFYEYAVQKGFIFSDPATAKAQPGMAKGQAKMFKLWADAGVPLSSEITMSFKGEGMFAQMMNKMGGGKIVSDTSKIDTATLSDDLFGVPAGYKTKEQ